MRSRCAHFWFWQATATGWLWTTNRKRGKPDLIPPSNFTLSLSLSLPPCLSLAAPPSWVPGILIRHQWWLLGCEIKFRKVLHPPFQYTTNTHTLVHSCTHTICGISMGPLGVITLPLRHCNWANQDINDISWVLTNADVTGDHRLNRITNEHQGTKNTCDRILYDYPAV